VLSPANVGRCRNRGRENTKNNIACGYCCSRSAPRSKKGLHAGAGTEKGMLRGGVHLSQKEKGPKKRVRPELVSEREGGHWTKLRWRRG